MAVVPYKYMCRQSGCGQTVTRSGYCAKHRRAYEKERGTAAKRGYDDRWRKARLAFLKEHPICAECKDELASVVDHKTPHKGDPELFWDQTNWQELCPTCHNRKTALEDGRWGSKRIK